MRDSYDSMVGTFIEFAVQLKLDKAVGTALELCLGRGEEGRGGEGRGGKAV